MKSSYTLASGNVMPGIGLGTWQSDPGVVGLAVMDALLEGGYRHIDCAAIYGNEAEIGMALKKVFETTTIDRKDVFITSKLWNKYHRPQDVEPALQQTLNDLGLDYLDLYLIHWPVVQDKETGSFLPLEDVPIAETWKAMEACVDKGLVKDIGVSNFSKKKLQQLLATARIPPSVNQVERHPYLAHPDLCDFCRERGIHVTAYSPLGTPGTNMRNMGSGDLEPILDHSTIRAIAAKHGNAATPAQVLIAWALECGTSAIPKSTKKNRILENIMAPSKVRLDADDVARIKSLDCHHRYVDGTFWCTPEGSPYTLENLWDEPAGSNGGGASPAESTASTSQEEL